MRPIFIIFLLTMSPAAKAQTVKLEAEINHSTVEFFVPISGGLTKISGKFTDYKVRLRRVAATIW